jgi:hypothetical protein
MPSANYVLLEKITVGAAGASSVTFSGIPQTGYTDLVVKISGRSTSTDDQIWISLNGSTTGFSNKVLYGSGSAAASTSVDRFAAYQTPGTGTTASTFGNSEIYIPNYTGSTNKSMSGDTVWEQNATTAYAALNASLWSNSAAITSITLTPVTSNFSQFSTFYLYGVAKLGTTPAIVPYATGGDTIMTDGTYWYHAFRSSGTFTPAKGLSCDVLVVAGGGGGGQFGGGGGAGGYLYTTSVSTSSAQTVTIGAGGTATGPADTGNRGGAGSTSSFGALSATGGSGGGGYLQAANTGGSGGGGGGLVATYTGGSATSGQGNAGANGTSASGGTPGGGGGSGASGSAKNGGIGLNTLSTWASVTGTGDSGYFAGGGGSGGDGSGGAGGTGGTGGGGAGGGASNNGVSGTANTGGGGGGIRGLGSAVSGTGGSGIVIVRYAV